MNHTFVQNNPQSWKKNVVVIIEENKWNDSKNKNIKKMYSDVYKNLMHDCGFNILNEVTMENKKVQEFILNLPKTDFLYIYQFISIGGDEQLHHIINGFYSRSDISHLELR